MFVVGKTPRRLRSCANSTATSRYRYRDKLPRWVSRPSHDSQRLANSPRLRHSRPSHVSLGVLPRYWGDESRAIASCVQRTRLYGSLSRRPPSASDLPNARTALARVGFRNAGGFVLPSSRLPQSPDYLY